MLEERDGFVLGQFRAEQGRPFPLGEPVATGTAVEQPMFLLPAIPAANRQIADPPLAVIRAIRVLTAETRKVFLHGSISVTMRRREEQVQTISLL
jgi:hypothetical protein